MSRKNYTIEKYIIKNKEEKLGGLYKSTRPSNAVKKAFNQICRMKKLKGKCDSIIIVIRETTRGSKKKMFQYKVQRKVLDKPKTIKKGDQEIVIKYDVKVTKMKLHQKEENKCCKSKLVKNGLVKCCDLPGIGVKKYYKCPPQSEKISCGGSSCNKKHKGGSCNKKH
jgi:hypothetical protein